MLANPKWGLDNIGLAMQKAADILQKGGHCKFTLEDSEKHHCFYGAIMIALYGELRPWAINHEIGEIARRTIRYKLGHTHGLTGNYAPMQYCVAWNNHPCTTAEEVEQALREGAYCTEDAQATNNAELPMNCRCA
jgi:hypothetical protein